MRYINLRFTYLLTYLRLYDCFEILETENVHKRTFSSYLLVGIDHLVQLTELFMMFIAC